MFNWSSALKQESTTKSVILFVNGKSFKVVVVDILDGSVHAKLFKSKEKALQYYEENLK